MPSPATILTLALSLAALTAATPFPQPNPLSRRQIPSAFSTGSKGLPLKSEYDASGGSGPYKATIFNDPTLPKHTIYAPQTPPPADVKLPVIVWGNGLCAAVGTFFQNFLTEVASHGYIVLANGAPGPQPKGPPPPPGPNSGGFLDSLTQSISLLSNGITTAKYQADSMSWLFNNAQGSKYGSIDLEKIAAAGQSCGGIESYTATLADPRIKWTVLFNSGYIDRSQATLKALKDLKGPVAYFLGDSTDVAFTNGKQDFALLPEGLPAVYANADIGHLGGFFEKQGGVNGRIAVPYFNWIMKGDEKAKSLFLQNGFKNDGWNITVKNWK